MKVLPKLANMTKTHEMFKRAAYFIGNKGRSLKKKKKKKKVPCR